VAFWLSYGLWLIRLKFVGPSPESGIDPFAGPLAIWVILLLPFLVYEAGVFLWGIVANRERTIAAIGMVAAIVQVLGPIRFASRLRRIHTVRERISAWQGLRGNPTVLVFPGSSGSHRGPEASHHLQFGLRPTISQYAGLRRPKREWRLEIENSLLFLFRYRHP